jgi:hypothetical protein
MKIYGYSIQETSPEFIHPSTLTEITLVASAKELRRIAAFILECADSMDSMGDKYDHVHLSDRDHSFKESPHFVVASLNETPS